MISGQKTEQNLKKWPNKVSLQSLCPSLGGLCNCIIMMYGYENNYVWSMQYVM